MSSTNCLEQKGIVEEVRNGIAKVAINSLSACSSCQAKSLCKMGDSELNLIDVAIMDNSFKQGDAVIVQMKRSLGNRAALIAYILPFFLILISLFIFTSIGIKEVYAGLISLSLLIPYYFVLHKFRSKLKRTFQFTLNKVN